MTSISVCMPIYNSSKYIVHAIESVLKQTLTDFERIIIDDCSTDDTGVIAAYFAERDERIQYIRNDTNAGMVNNWNRCLEKATGRYIKFLFGDDLLADDALEQMAGYLDANPDVGLVASARILIDDSNTPIETLAHFDTRIYEGSEIIKVCFLQQNNLVGEPTAVMFRKELAGRGFNSDYRQMVDLEMWFHLLDQGDFAYIKQPLCSFRVHPEQQTKKNIQSLFHYSEFFLLMEEYINRPYMNFSRIYQRTFLFEKYYTFWKIFRHKPEYRHTAEEIVARQYGWLRFYCFVPLYKLYNPVRKLIRAVMFLKRPVTQSAATGI